MLKHIIYPDGRFSIGTERFGLRDAYPAADGKQISPESVSVDKNSICYRMPYGKLFLRFSDFRGGKGLRLSVRLQDVNQAVEFHDFEPIAGAELYGTDMLFQQGFGMAGPSGCLPIQELSGRAESFGLISLFSQEGAGSLSICASDYRHVTAGFLVAPDQGLFMEKKVVLSAGFNLEGVPGEMECLPKLIFLESTTLQEGLDETAELIAGEMEARQVMPPAFHWCSWYYLYQNLTQGLLEEYVRGMRQKEVPFQYVQIDAGYADSPGDWLIPGSRFPEGLEKASRTIRDAGYEPGIWIAPFMVGEESELYKAHPDWLLRGTDGSPVAELSSFVEPKVWGNRDSHYYILDTSNPEAMAYLRKVFTTLRGWGFRLFKTDFMLWNMKDTSKVRRFDNTRTSVEILRDTLDMIREVIGEDSYLLGCIAPFMPFIGYADGMRIAGDVGAQWTGAFSPENMLREVSADTYFNQVFWQNDPDSVLLRNFDTQLREQEIRSLALLQAISGGIVTTSDPLHRLGEKSLKLLSFIRPDKEKHRPDVPGLNGTYQTLIMAHRLKQGNLLYLLNAAEKDILEQVDLSELFGKSGQFCLEYEESESISKYGTCLADGPADAGNAGKKPVYGADRCSARHIAGRSGDRIFVSLKPHECALFFLTDQKLREQPGNLWKW